MHSEDVWPLTSGSASQASAGSLLAMWLVLHAGNQAKTSQFKVHTWPGAALVQQGSAPSPTAGIGGPGAAPIAARRGGGSGLGSAWEHRSVSWA